MSSRVPPGDHTAPAETDHTTLTDDDRPVALVARSDGFVSQLLGETHGFGGRDSALDIGVHHSSLAVDAAGL